MSKWVSGFIFKGLVLFSVFSAMTAFPLVRVAFLELVDIHGRPFRLEPDFPYGHIAISFENGWVHSYPGVGVEWVSYTKLKTYGRVREFIDLDIPALSHAQVNEIMGLPYDTEFSWGGDKVYCSELVAKMLRMKPVPMHFDPKIWPAKYQQFEGLPGISPGIIYRRLKQGLIE